MDITARTAETSAGTGIKLLHYLLFPIHYSLYYTQNPGLGQVHAWVLSLILFEEIIENILKSLALGGGALADGAVELTQQILLGGSQLGGGLHHHVEVMVAPELGVIHLGDALAAQDEFPAGLGALGDGVGHLAVQGGHFDLRAQGRLGKGDGDLAVYVKVPPPEELVGPDMDLGQQVAGPSRRRA